MIAFELLTLRLPFGAASGVEGQLAAYNEQRKAGNFAFKPTEVARLSQTAVDFCLSTLRPALPGSEGARLDWKGFEAHPFVAGYAPFYQLDVLAEEKQELCGTIEQLQAQLKEAEAQSDAALKVLTTNVQWLSQSTSDLQLRATA